MEKKLTDRLSFRIAFILILILLFSLTVNTLLNFFNFEKTYRDLVFSRFYVSGRDLKNSVEYQLNLGLALQEMKNLQLMIDELKKKDKTISAIEICDESGLILFHTDTEKTGGVISFRLRSEIRKHDRAKGTKPAEKTVTVADGGKIYIIIPVMNSFSMRVGAIAMAYHDTIIAGPMKRTKVFLLLLFLGTLLVFSAVAFVAVNLASSGPRTKIAAMDDSLKDLIAGKVGAEEPLEMHGMDRDFHQFRSTTERVLSEIAELSNSVESVRKEIENDRET